MQHEIADYDTEQKSRDKTGIGFFCHGIKKGGDNQCEKIPESAESMQDDAAKQKLFQKRYNQDIVHQKQQQREKAIRNQNIRFQQFNLKQT